MQAIAAVCNMALQHHEFELRLRDAERLQLFVQAGMEEREMHSVSLKKFELACRRLELEAKESAERAARAEAERDTTRHEAAMAKLATEGAVNTRAPMESKLPRVQSALVLVEEARRRAEFEHGAAREALKELEEENSQLANEKVALIIELGVLKDDFFAFRDKAAADREAIEAEFDSSGDTFFNYGYGCCAFMYNICGSKPQIKIPEGMSNPSVPLTAEFFAYPRCPPGSSAAASTLDPIAVGGEECSENSPAAAGEEAVLPMDQEETVLPTDQEETILLTDQEKAILPTYQEKVILPMDQEKAILPTDLPTE